MMAVKLVHLGFLAIILWASKGGYAAVDLTDDPTAIGSVVVKAVTAKLNSVFNSSSIIWQPRYSVFMEILAYIESMDGLDKTDSNSGIWKPNLSYLAGFNMPGNRPEFENAINMDLSKLNFTSVLNSIIDHLQNPIRSAIAARLVFLEAGLTNNATCGQFPLDSTSDQNMADFWIYCYQTITSGDNYNELNTTFFDRLSKYRKRDAGK